MKNKTVTLALGVAAALAASGAYADNAGPNDVRVGMYFVYFDSHATDISGPYAPSGLNLKVNNLETLYLAYVRSFSNHFKVELAFGWPPLTKTVGSGPATLGSVPYNGQTIATARWLSPTLLAEYEFGDANSRLRPYVGAGVNYTKFLSRQSTAAGDAASGGPTSISLPSSLGPAVTAGLSYEITDRWHVYASYSVARVNSHLTADTAGILRTSQIEFWPMTLVVSAGYSF
ncbi:MAG TPA: OmpW family outer membrane protein [Steroidobacteraceae bacterium]|nr:OmpW family outer membrane protein [Steroidobacteraceae bacterium]